MASADAWTANWPFGLFLSEHTFAIIVFAAIPGYNTYKTSYIWYVDRHTCIIIPLNFSRWSQFLNLDKCGYTG